MFKDKLPGFYLSMALILFNAIMTITYAAAYHVTMYMSWLVFGVFLFSTLVGIALLFLGKLKWYAAVSFVATLIGIGGFVLSTFNYIVDAIVGIDVTSLSGGFVGCLMLLAVLFAASFVANLLKTEEYA